MFFAVRLERGGPSDWSRELRDQNGMLTIKSIEPWTILLDGRAAPRSRRGGGGGTNRSLRLRQTLRRCRWTGRSSIALAVTLIVVAVAGALDADVAFATPSPLAPSAAAPPPLAWSAPSHIDGLGDLTSVSCPTPSFCMAVDENGQTGVGNALRWNGSAWSAPTKVEPYYSLAAVSCASASFCMAVSGGGPPYRWNGTSWSTAADPEQNIWSGSVSCPSRTFCMTVSGVYGGAGFIWNGQAWSLHTVIPQASYEGGGFGLFSVSCPSAAFCMALGFDPEEGVDAFTWNGSAWSGPTEVGTGFSFSNPDGTDALYPSLSCVSASFCVVAGAEDIAYVWNGASWSAPRHLGAIGYVLSVSCASTSLCVVLGGNDRLLAVEGNGTSWSTPAKLGGIDDIGPTVASVSCRSSTSFCMVVEENGDAVRTDLTPTCGTLSSLLARLNCYATALKALKSAVLCGGDLLAWGFGPLKLLKGVKTLKGLYDLRSAGRLKPFYKAFNGLISALQGLKKLLAKVSAKGGPSITTLLDAMNSEKVKTTYDLTKVIFAWGLTAASSVSRADLHEFAGFFAEFARDFADLAGISDCADLVFGDA